MCARQVPMWSSIAETTSPETGYAYEVAVPIDLIAEHQGADWDRIRVNVAVDDFDDEDGPRAQLWWQPDWRDAVNVPGSGTFRRPR